MIIVRQSRGYIKFIMPETTQNSHGGKRPGAGRKKGSSAYGEVTQAIRVPESLLPRVKALLEAKKLQYEQLADNSTAIFFPARTPDSIALPLFTCKVAAGFPSQADDYVDKTIDLNELLIQKPTATFFVHAQGESMLGAGIHPNDILIVHRSIEPVTGKIVICALNGELTVKRLERDGEQWKLKAENPAYPDIAIHDEMEMVIWGVVTNVIHPV
jgi:DNA polymerase V